MEEMFLPVRSHFQNGNTWMASLGRLSFRILPDPPEEEDGEGGTFTVEVWEGPWAYEFSTVEESAVFPLTDEALAGLPQWLFQRADKINARPARTLEENIARRVEPSKKEDVKK